VATPQHVAESVRKRGGQKAPVAIHGSLDLKFLPTEKANTIADCLLISSHPTDLCHENNEWRVVVTFRALLQAENGSPPEGPGPCAARKLIRSLEKRTASFGSRISRKTPRKKT
jgi:hypothetical protein